MFKSRENFTTREMRQKIRRLFALSLCGIILLTQWACVRTAGPLSENFIQKPITIGVTTGKFIPSTVFEKSEIVQLGNNWGRHIGPPPPVLLALALLVLIGYGTYKIFEQMQKLFSTLDYPQEIPKSSEEDRQPILTPRERLENALAELRMQETFGKVFVTKARASTPHTIILVKEYGPQTKDDLPSNYSELLEQNLDMILELRIESIGLINAGGGDDPSFSLAMKVRVRLIGLPGQNNLYNDHFYHRSEQHTFREWSDKQGQPFEEAITHAYEDLANQIIIHRKFFVKTTT